ncbi:MAG TPA: hypothetical protein VMV97_03090 [Sulfuriferula sp.]|nr:hypothetical protein [Sulfuriferula sp.]
MNMTPKTAGNLGQKATSKQSELSLLLAHQADIECLGNTIINLEDLIATKQREASAAAAAVPSIEHLSRTREDLLAGVAVGQATHGEVQAFDTKSEAEKKAHQEALATAKRIANEASQAIAGLQRKLAEAQGKLHALHGRDMSLLRAVVMNQAETTCHEYVKAALAVKAAYLRLTALDGLLKSKGLKPAGIISGGVPINLPVFQLPACEGQFNPNWPDSIFSDSLAYVSGATNQAADDLLEELRAIGVTLI